MGQMPLSHDGGSCEPNPMPSHREIRMRANGMRVLHVIPNLKRGGAERICLDMVRAMQTVGGVEVRLAVLNDRNEYAEEYPGIGPVNTMSHVIPSVSGKWKVDVGGFDRLVAEFRPDIVHSHLFEAEMVSRINLAANARYFSHCHDNMPQLRRFSPKDLGSKRRLTELYERNFLLGRYDACANRFIAISGDTAIYFKENLPKRMHDGIHLLHNAIDVSRFSGSAAVPPSGGGPLRLVNVGSFVPKKNQTFLLDVLSSLTLSDVDAELVLTGDGPLRDGVTARAGEMGLSGRVSFPGSVSNVQEFLWKSHVYVHAATYEPFGLVLLEAMAAGLPVVSLNGRGNVGLVRDGFNGYMLDEADPQQFAERILRCVKDSDTWLAMSSNAREFSASFDIGAYTGRLLTLYRESLRS
jgi:glycosyltransferase involved in cell wall biosynthesis